MRRSILFLAFFAAVGCSSVLGFKDPSLEDDGPADAPGADGPAGDAAIDAPPATNLWVFTTNAAFTGDFGVASGARVTADIKCDDMYQATFTSRQCTQIRAVIQIDNTSDTLARMAQNFQIPQGVQVLRATDAGTVTADWTSLINPSVQLISPVSLSSSAELFWSGRGVTSNLQCTNWTSASNSISGHAGDATKTNGWVAQASVPCNNLERFLCVCW